MSKLYEMGKDYFDLKILPDGKIAIEILLGDFRGKYKYTYDQTNLYRLMKDLEHFYTDDTELFYEFYDTDSDSYIVFNKKTLGHLTVSGQLGSKFSGNYLCFVFESDQTLISLFIEKISEWLK